MGTVTWEKAKELVEKINECPDTKCLEELAKNSSQEEKNAIVIHKIVHEYTGAVLAIVLSGLTGLDLESPKDLYEYLTKHLREESYMKLAFNEVMSNTNMDSVQDLKEHLKNIINSAVTEAV